MFWIHGCDCNRILVLDDGLLGFDDLYSTRVEFKLVGFFIYKQNIAKYILVKNIICLVYSFAYVHNSAINKQLTTIKESDQIA